MVKCLTAHPRSRGEHISSSPIDTVIDGSSPLARGTRQDAVRESLRYRLIPARAGNTGTEATRFAITSAHPRSRGEHVLGTFCFLLGCGSSPLARGTPCQLFDLLAFRRLIPARAGNTLQRFAHHDVTPAHPRLLRGTYSSHHSEVRTSLPSKENHGTRP